MAGTGAPSTRLERYVQARASWLVLAAFAGLGCLVAFEPDRGDVAIYRQAARAAVSTGAVYAYQHQGHGFTYPPFAALVLAALAWLPNWAMWSVLVVVGTASLVVVLTLCVPGVLRAVRRRAGPALLGAAVLAVSEPVATTLRFGQLDLLLAALVLIDLLVLRRGFLVGFATAMKLTPGLFIVFLIVRRRYGEALAATGTLVASIVWGFVVLPGTSTTYWTHNTLSGTGVGSFTTVGNQSLHGVVSRAVGSGAGTPVWLVLAGPVLVCGLALAGRAADAGCELLAIGTVGVTACLVSPVSWPHHWVWLLPLLCGLWGLRARDPRLTRWLVGTAAFAVVSQFVPLKAVGIGYVPIAIALLVLEHSRLPAAVRTGQRPGRVRPFS